MEYGDPPYPVDIDQVQAPTTLPIDPVVNKTLNTFMLYLA